jgi:hypothetical protein
MTEAQREPGFCPGSDLTDLTLLWLRWRALPPLVRASAAAALMQHMNTNASRLLRDAETCDHAGLARRARVTRLFADAAACVRDAAVILAREADTEAALRGVDADVETGAFVDATRAPEET